LWSDIEVSEEEFRANADRAQLAFLDVGLRLTQQLTQSELTLGRAFFLLV